MNYRNDNSILINGGPFIVDTNSEGGITRNYGWASLLIQQINECTMISILCNNLCENINDLVIHRFQINKKIPKELYEDITIMFQRGFNTLYYKNFSKNCHFKKCCESYFQHTILNFKN